MRFLIIIFIYLSLFGCSEKQNIRIEQDEERFWDSLCIVEKDSAQIEIKSGKLVYHHVFGMVEEYRSNAEMDSLLKRYSIETGRVGYLCMAPIDKQMCYADEMVKAIKQKFGSNFIDSLRLVAENLYVQKHINDTFRFEECDTISRYPNTKNYSDFFKKYEKDFFETFEYPKEYKPKEEKYYSHTSGYFILHKDGSISGLELETTFQNKENEKFTHYFENEITKFIYQTEWIPATTLGYKVNSEMELTFFYK